jgi:hypothetical protein
MDTEISTTLDLNDIKALASIIEVSTTRGAFKANEMTVIGRVYDKLNFTLQQAQQATTDKAASIVKSTDK